MFSRRNWPAICVQEVMAGTCPHDVKYVEDTKQVGKMKMYQVVFDAKDKHQARKVNEEIYRQTSRYGTIEEVEIDER